MGTLWYECANMNMAAHKINKTVTSEVLHSVFVTS